jgi:hypothetical protein
MVAVGPMEGDAIRMVSRFHYIAVLLTSPPNNSLIESWTYSAQEAGERHERQRSSDQLPEEVCVFGAGDRLT